TKVGANMSRVHAWKEVVDKVTSHLSRWNMKMLSIGGRFTLIKSVLGSMPIFHMSIFKVPSSVLQKLESIRSHFFNGHDIRSKKTSWVKWNKTRVIKAIHGSDGRLGQELKAGIRTNWTNIVQEVKQMQNQGVNFFEYIRLKLGNGDNTLFWEDKWCKGGVLKDLFTRLYALELMRKSTVSVKLSESSLENSFRQKVRSGVEEAQLGDLYELISTATLSPSVDRYDVTSLTRWVKSVPIKVNIIGWKIKIDALPTRYNISRRGIEIDSIACPICNGEVETTSHLFFQSRLVRLIARKLSSWWNVDHADVNTYEEWYTWMASLRIKAKLKSVFEGIFYGLWWSIWDFRNKLLFEKEAPSQAAIFDNIVSISFNWCKFRWKASFKWND
nr:RNA-directed DNA polymerase, eukaryota [Tanacetum cinerariifolium]